LSGYVRSVRNYEIIREDDLQMNSPDDPDLTYPPVD